MLEPNGHVYFFPPCKVQVFFHLHCALIFFLSVTHTLCHIQAIPKPDSFKPQANPLISRTVSMPPFDANTSRGSVFQPSPYRSTFTNEMGAY